MSRAEERPAALLDESGAGLLWALVAYLVIAAPLLAWTLL